MLAAKLSACGFMLQIPIRYMYIYIYDVTMSIRNCVFRYSCNPPKSNFNSNRIVYGNGNCELVVVSCAFTAIGFINVAAENSEDINNKSNKARISDWVNP